MHFVVIGNGIAGISAASAIRRLKRKAPITIFSDEHHPTYSACVLANYVSGELSREGVFVKAIPACAQDNIRFMLDQKVIGLDVEGKKVILEGDSLPYDRLVLATGSKPIIPPIKGSEKEGVFTFKSLMDADRIFHWNAQRVAVIGSGPIGVEASLALKKKGCRVFLVELLEWILPRAFDEYPASLIKDLLAVSGIEILTQERVVEIVGNSRVQGIVTDKHNIECDMVILAAGMRPEVSLTERVLELGKLGGILVDDMMRTNVQDVFACGDCVEARDLVSGYPALSLLWHNARQQGEVAGYNATGVPRTYSGSLNILKVDISGIQAVSIGMPSQDSLEVIEKQIDRQYCRLILSHGVLVGAQAIGWNNSIGALLAAIVRREKIRDSKHLIIPKRFPFAFPGLLPSNHWLSGGI